MKMIFAAILLLAVTFALPMSALASFNGILPLTTSGSMPAPLAGPTITMSSYNLTVGQTATVTFTFPAPPLAFATSDIMVANGTISNLASTSNTVYTALFTPATSTNVSTNAISVRGKVIGINYTDPNFNEPFGIAFDGTNMWITNSNTTTISKITPSGSVTTYGGFNGPSGIAFDGTNMWVTNYGYGGQSGLANTVVKVGPSGSIIGSSTVVGLAPTAIAFDGTNMWSANYLTGTSSGSVSEIAPNGTVILTASTSPGPSGIAFDGTNMWTANYGNFSVGDGDSVTKISPTGTTTTIGGIPSGPVAIAFDGTNMWTANFGGLIDDFTILAGGKSVTKITPTGATTTYGGLDLGPSAIAFDGTNMWVSTYGMGDGNSVAEVAPDGTVQTYTGVGLGSSGIAFDGTNMWTANEGDDNYPNPIGSVTKITGVISSSTSANYVVDTVPPASPSPSAGNLPGGQVSPAQLATLLAPSPAATAYLNSLKDISSSVPISSTSPAAATTSIFTSVLQIGSTGPEVMTLQKYLNSQGFLLTASGPGSPGDETERFGLLTSKALSRFQEAHFADILAPVHLSRGTGMLGPQTIAFINAHQ